MFEKIKNLKKKNIKYIFQSLERFSKVNFYSNYGKNKFYFRIIYLIFLLSKIFFLFKKNYFLIFKKNKIEQNLICIITRSGNNLIRCIFSSYYELNYNLGNGIPKYDVVRDRWKFNFELNHSNDLYGATLEDKKIFNPNNIVFTQFPINKVNLVNTNHMRPVILIRNPKDLLFSWYIHDIKNKNQNHFNELLFKKRIKNINFAFSYWEKFMKGKINKKDFLLIKFEDLVQNLEETIISIFFFFDIEFNKENLIKSIKLNSIDNHKLYMNYKTDTSVRFSNEKDKNTKEFILNKINNQISTSLY